MLRRVAVGRLEGRPKHTHCELAGSNAGKLPLAPTMPVYTITDNNLYITAMPHRVACIDNARGTQNHEDLS
ncbi:hypothetical protein E4T81_08685 [Barnesiella sp. WM24]|uniref:hypothetical protein n=1 Tax=Barnesiella sp. WM24 TaxID=2558278 RepID=UPI001072C488|nr:hypothetical protein [Barnesiella sp. WM24]TFU93033.1 hypothetical protein E4T81_08685 [Barnesiella sp. WM24]